MIEDQRFQFLKLEMTALIRAHGVATAKEKMRIDNHSKKWVWDLFESAMYEAEETNDSEAKIYFLSDFRVRILTALEANS